VHQLVIKEGSVLLMHGVTMKFIFNDVIKILEKTRLKHGMKCYSVPSLVILLLTSEAVSLLLVESLDAL